MTGTVGGALVGGLIGFVASPAVSVLTTRPPLLDAKELPSLKFRCDSCGSALKAMDSVPLVSFVIRRGRCRLCGGRISRWDFAAEILSVVVGALVGWRVGLVRELPAFLVLGLVSVIVLLVDARLHKIATRLIYPATALGFVLLAFAGLTGGRRGDVLVAALGGVAASAFIWFLVLVYPAGMGDGDARLVLFLGMFLGWFGWRYVYLGLTAGFLLGSVFGLGIAVVKRTGRKTKFAFGPYLCAGALFVVLWPGIFSSYMQ